MPHLFNTATQVTVLIEIPVTLHVNFIVLHETAVLSRVTVIHKQKGPITFMTPNANFTTFALEHRRKPQTVSELPGDGSCVTLCTHAAQHPADFGTQDSVSKKVSLLSSRKFVIFFFHSHTPYLQFSLISGDRRGLQSLPDNVRRVFERSPQLEAA